MSWTEIWFGKYAGRTLPQVVFEDPDWFFWAIENNVFADKSSALIAEASDKNNKARHIKVPQIGKGKLVIEYYRHSPTKRFSHSELVPIGRPHHSGSSPTLRGDVIDMSVPRCIAS